MGQTRWDWCVRRRKSREQARSHNSLVPQAPLPCGRQLAADCRQPCGRELAPDICISGETHHELGMVTRALAGDNSPAPRGRSHAAQTLQSGHCVDSGAAIKCNGEAGKAWIGREANAGVLSAL